MTKYNPVETEKKWQQRWEEEKVNKVNLNDESKPKYYNLVMFPYPSGDRLHVGHWYNFAPADSFGRFMRMKGFNVLEPMGFDAFGLPAENHAIKTGTPPAKSIAANTATMVDQLKKIGTMYDLRKTMNTSEPAYYRWTQWVFLKMYEHGIAYKKAAAVNWCDTCHTVLANEQAQDGTCERCSTEVIQKPLKQWFWKITDYAQRLLDGLDGLDWPEKTKLMQQNWIGRSEGAEVIFALDKGGIRVFTTRPDTLFGATYIVLAPEHPIVSELTTGEQSKEVLAYIKTSSKKTEIQRTDLEKDKTGVFTGGYAVNPVDGRKIPVWIADYVLMNYGTGAIMAVPGHDERDFVFAKKFDLPLLEVVSGGDIGEAAFTGAGKAINSGFLNGLATADAKKKIIEWLEEKKLGRGIVNFRLRDWLISRQRYWGAPIPIVYDPDGNAHPVPEEHLPWLLPTDTEFKPKGTSPLGQSKELLERTEKLFGKGWKPEIDTMDTFVCSSFYYLRYLMAESGGKDFIDPKIEKKWMPVDMYIGGPEHACMHLIYARFVMMALKDFGFVSHGEPFKRLVHQGLITNQGAKMSKSKGNTVSPDEFVNFYGSDVFRMYLMFMGPFTDGGDWSDKGITGIARFASRFYGFVAGDLEAGYAGTGAKTDGSSKVADDAAKSAEAAVLSALHKTIKRVTEDIEKMQFNTAIAALMEFLNGALKTGLQMEEKRLLVRLIAPLAPHLAEELWEKLGGAASGKGVKVANGSVFNQSWPEYDSALTVSATFMLAVQVNGKVRGQVEVAADISQEEAFAVAATAENVAKHLEGKEIVKKIFVPGKLVSFVVK